jgi:large subunit ribosomal protein LP0
MGGKSANKAGYFDKLKGLLEEYQSIFIVSVDNVSSQQMHEIRQSLRGEGVVLMGKNTMVDILSCASYRELVVSNLELSRFVVP